MDTGKGEKNMGALYKDYEEFKDRCIWWPEVQRYIDAQLPMGWTFCGAFDLDGRGLKYLVTFRQYEPPASADVVFDYSSGSIQISGCIPCEP